MPSAEVSGCVKRVPVSDTDLSEEESPISKWRLFGTDKYLPQRRECQLFTQPLTSLNKILTIIKILHPGASVQTCIVGWVICASIDDSVEE